MTRHSVLRVLVLTAMLSASASNAFGSLVITGNFTSNFNTFFGSNAAAAQAAWNAAAAVFMANFSDNIHINITVDAVSGTSILGQSTTSLIGVSYANMRTLLVADSKSADDALSVGAGGSVTSADPTGGTGNWWLARGQAKALGLIFDDLVNDGTTTFGAGFSYTFSGATAAGTFDFQGVVAHEITEVMGRLGICGGSIGPFSNSYSALDDFSYTGAGTKGLGNGAGNSFSINGGTTLVKGFNNAASNGGDCRDWASGTNDAFNAFSSSGVSNPVSATDLRVMDVIGYDLATPEPATMALIGAGLCLLAGIKKFRRK